VTKIYYPGGIGNDLWSAKRMARIIGEPCELRNIGLEAEKGEIIIDAKAVIFVYPIRRYL
jgi:hypothetical protein